MLNVQVPHWAKNIHKITIIEIDAYRVRAGGLVIELSVVTEAYSDQWPVTEVGLVEKAIGIV
jgi:hypothetical protein